MTEDGTKCDVLMSSDRNADVDTIINVDSEKRNYCFRKVSNGCTDCALHLALDSAHSESRMPLPKSASTAIGVIVANGWYAEVRAVWG